MSDATDTIAAPATPPGRGGVGIVRVSGPDVPKLARALLGACPAPRRAEYRTFHDAAGEVIDAGIALYFPAPHSFTGEDVLELQGHGGPVVLDLILAATLTAGARHARPGEFSERAFLTGKLDLAQAEAVADLIDAASAQAARSALRPLQGVFSARIGVLVEELVQLRTYVEAAIDFPDEEVDFLADGEVGQRIEALRDALEHLRAGARQGRLLRDGMTVVLAGRPNAGKSSLLNALAGHDAAIVTDIPGTTRDVLRERILIDGMPLHIIDTAGLRESADPIEREGVRRAWKAIIDADRLLLIVDDCEGIGAEEEAILGRLPEGLARTVVLNKADLSGRPTGLSEASGEPEIRVCAKTGEGVDLLRKHLKALMGYHEGEGEFTARRRHLEALDEAAGHLDSAAERLERDRAGELVAEELRLTQHALGQITGEFTSDDLLGRIFANFCIGK